MDFLGIGDLHLSGQSGHGGFSKFLPDSDAYILSEVQRVVDAGKEKGIERCIIYGDICDSVRMSYRAHLALLDFFTRNKDMFFYLILGNHDKFAKDSGLGHSCELLQKFGLKNIRVFASAKTLKFSDGSRVNFLPFPESGFKPCLNVCHLDLSGAVTDNGRVLVDKINPEGFQIVSGHIHSASHFSNVWYSGTLFQLNFGEDVRRKGYHLIETCGNDAEIQFVPFHPKFELRTLVAKSAEELKHAEAKNIFYRLFLPAGNLITPADYAHLSVTELKTFDDEAALKDLQSTLTPEFESLDLDVGAMFERVLATRYDEASAEALRNCRNRMLAKG